MHKEKRLTNLNAYENLGFERNLLKYKVYKLCRILDNKAHTSLRCSGSKRRECRFLPLTRLVIKVTEVVSKITPRSARILG